MRPLLLDLTSKIRVTLLGYQNQEEIDIIMLFSSLKGVKAACRSTKSYRSAPGGSGAGCSVVIVTQSIMGNPNGKILVTGGSPTKCAWGVGGGTSKVPFCTKKVKLLALLFIT